MCSIECYVGERYITGLDSYLYARLDRVTGPLHYENYLNVVRRQCRAQLRIHSVWCTPVLVMDYNAIINGHHYSGKPGKVGEFI